MTGLSTNYNLVNILFLGLCRIVNTWKWLCAGVGMIIHISRISTVSSLPLQTTDVLRQFLPCWQVSMFPCSLL